MKIFDWCKMKLIRAEDYELQPEIRPAEFFLKTIPEQDRDIFRRLELDRFGAYVAGGAALRWYQGLPLFYNQDIDIWLPGSLRGRKLFDYETHVSKFADKTYESNNATTFKLRHTSGTRDLRLQIISVGSEEYDSIVDVLDDFDITITKIATDGVGWIFESDFDADFRNKILRFDRINEHSVKRLIKYWNLGFQPSDETLTTIQNNPDVCWDFYYKLSEDDYEAM
jgi:hypothetical protein